MVDLGQTLPLTSVTSRELSGVHWEQALGTACGSAICLIECADLFEMCLECERLTELCAVSACEHLLCIIKKFLTKYYWFAVFGKIQSTFLLYF